MRAHRAAARRALVGELDRHGAAVATAEATLARAVATRDDLLAQILGWADPAYTGDAMARHAGRSAEAVNAQNGWVAGTSLYSPLVHGDAPDCSLHRDRIATIHRLHRSADSPCQRRLETRGPPGGNAALVPVNPAH